MGLDATKHVFWVSDKARFILISSATETSLKIENPLLVASLDNILPKKQITLALISLHGYTGWSVSLLFANPKDRFKRISVNLEYIFEEIKIWKENDGVARTLKKVRTSKGDYWIKQLFSSIVSLFNMGTSLKGQNYLPEGANSFLYEQFIMVWKITFITLSDLS